MKHSAEKPNPTTMADNTVMIRAFQAGDESAFRDLNVEWITKGFAIEEKDEQAFRDPRGKILEHGGHILLALVGAVPVGCVALLRMSDGEYELAKMAVTERMRGAGIGRKLIDAAIEKARELGAARMYLETNHTLTPAIRLYESAGFVHIPPERKKPSPYARADVAMERVVGSAEHTE